MMKMITSYFKEQFRVGAKDKSHIGEAEAVQYAGSPVKVTLVTLKMSVKPKVPLASFEITPPVACS